MSAPDDHGNARVHGATFSVADRLQSFRYRLSGTDWRWLTVAIVLVWVAETMNTAFEYLCDVVSPEFHVSVAKAKDIAAGAVMICSAGAVVLGLLTFWPYLWK
jgi:diacylglycerol kinase (ATP)